MNTNHIFYVTHIVPDELPTSGWRKLLFYTTPDPNERPRRFSWGISRNYFDDAYMNSLVEKRKLLALPREIKIDRGSGLWLTPEGKIVVADLKRPFDDAKSNIIWAPDELSPATQRYKRDIGTENIPRPNRMVVI